MQPKIVKMDKFFIVGLYGHIKKQNELQDRLNEQYAKTPFSKKSKYQTQMYYWGNRNPDKQVFYGFESEPTEDGGAFTVIEIPACEWAVFEVNTAKWWDTGDKEVEGWIINNPQYQWRKLEGSNYLLEYWKEKFNGTQPDSMMEVWYPLEEHKISAHNKACPVYDNHPYNKKGVCPCGDVSQYIDITKIIEAYDKSDCMDSFINELNHISDEKIWFDEEQSTIYMRKNPGGNPQSKTLIGQVCHCKHYHHSTEHYPKYYCKCCAEFSRPMFESIFGENIELFMFKTVLSGDQECVTAVKINDSKKIKGVKP